MHVVPLQLGLTPHAAALRLSRARGLCWLDGEAEHAPGRWSFVGVEPVERVERRIEEAAPLSAFDLIEREVSGRAAHAADAHGLPLEELPRWAGFVAYDAAFAGAAAGSLPRAAGTRVLSFARYDAWLAFGHAGQGAWLIGDDEAAAARLLARLEHGGVAEPRASVGTLVGSDPERHRAAIAQALEHIAAGDFYQVNLARSFRAAFAGEPLALFLALRAASPVPLGMYFDAGELVIASRTMERFLRFERDQRALSTRPIKGTRARAGDRDESEGAALRADAKERAEHAMIVDLMRNDLGRVAEVGSVQVPEVMVVEPYRRLHHLVSTVRCRVREGIGLRAILEATFPPGSVTGTPKLAAIEHIERLEEAARGVYTGALGFVDQRGGLSLAVAIRTAVIENGALCYGSGGGIVEASDPARELAETELKAQTLRDALASLEAAREQGFEPR